MWGGHTLHGRRCEHVVRVLDVDSTDDGAPFMVMEHLHGKDLGAVLRESGRQPVDKAVRYVLEACEALEAALDAFDGAVLLVSHDRALIDAIADETLSIEQLGRLSEACAALAPHIGRAKPTG